MKGIDSSGSTLAIIPARGGSKGVPKKNIRPVAGRPLIGYAIRACLASEHVGRTLVSTDDREIAHVAYSCGADVPFLRPAELARDDSPTVDALLHALEWLKDTEGYVPECILLVQATSPLLRADDIGAAHAILNQKGADSVVSVCEAHPPPYWMHQVDEDGRLVDFIETIAESRRQDMPAVYERNGALWLARTKVLIDHKSYITEETYAYQMDRERSLQVDEEFDLLVADFLLNREEQH